MGCLGEPRREPRANRGQHYPCVVGNVTLTLWPAAEGTGGKKVVERGLRRRFWSSEEHTGWVLVVGWGTRVPRAEQVGEEERPDGE